MVRIIGYKERNKEDGTAFFVLELQGGIEMVQSKATGNYYATAKKAFLPSTFDEQTCKALLGTEMQGQIIKQECEPYEYLVKETGEEILISHRWVYIAEENPAPRQKEIPQTTERLKPNVEEFSQNGVLEHA